MVPAFPIVLTLLALAGCRGERGSADTVAGSLPAAVPDLPADSTRPGPSRVRAQGDLLVSMGGMGRIRLGSTLDELRRALPGASIRRTTDGDGVALVEVTLGPDTAVVVYAGEEDADAAIDWTRRVERIEAFSTAFHTAEGVRPGALVTDVGKVLGKVTDITVSEIESRQYVTFEKQPSWLTLRLDYTGVFAEGSRTTTRHEPNARIFSIAVAQWKRTGS